MERIEAPMGRSYQEVKKEAGTMMANDLSISSIRVIVRKDLQKMWIEITRFPKNVVDKLKSV